MIGMSTMTTVVRPSSVSALLEVDLCMSDFILRPNLQVLAKTLRRDTEGGLFATTRLDQQVDSQTFEEICKFLFILSLHIIEANI